MNRQLTRQIVGLCMLFVVLVGLGAAMPQRGLPTPPTIRRLTTFKGEVFDNFVELRVQKVKFDEFGVFTTESEPYIMLLNIDYIISLHRFEDAEKKDYSCLMYLNHPDKKYAILVRQEYKKVLSLIKRAADR